MHNKLVQKVATQTFPKGKALLALSGGVDSMVLWTLCRALKIPHLLAHFNFQLRTEESDADQKFVERLARARNTKILVKTASAEDYASLHNLSIQEAAREMRYNWFHALIDQGEADYLMTAHHLDDSLETFLINLDRGTGLKGLGGIRSRKKLFRPLLNCSKAELIDYAEVEQVEFREDSSNLKDAYLRNWFRQHLIPLWKSKNPDLLDRMQANFIRFRESQEVLEHYLAQEVNRRLESGDGVEEFDLHDFQQLPFPETVLWQWLAKYGFHRDQLGQLLQSIAQKNSGSTFSSQSHLLLMDREKLILKSAQEEHASTLKILRPALYSLANFQINIEEIQEKPTVLDVEGVEYFDGQTLEYPLEFRKWEEGDRMQVMGMKGTKKISDILIDEKIDQFSKQHQYVMLSNSKIAWLLGLRISEAFKIKSSTKKVVRIQWTKA